MADFNENMDASTGNAAQGGMEPGVGAGRGLGQVPPVAQEPVSAAPGMPQGAPAGYGQPRAPRPQGMPQGMPQGQMPQGRPQGYPQGYPQGGQMPSRRPGYPQGQMPSQGYPQGMPQGQGMPPRGGAGAAAYGRGQYGQPGQPGQGMPPQGYPQGAPRPGQNPYQAQYARGQYGQGAPRPGQGNPNNYNQRVAGARAAGMGAAGAYGANRGGRGVNVQLMDQNGGSRYGRNVSTNAGAYKKDFGGNGPKIIKFVLLGILALVLFALVFFGVKACKAFNAFHGEDPGEADALAGVLTEVEKSDPFYMLLLGADAAKYRDEFFGEGTHNVADTIMIVRVDPGHKKITLISLLRDSWIDTTKWDDSIWALVDDKFKPYITSEIKANSLYQYGGAPLAVAALSKYLEIPISHYASINMDGFVALVDAVGEIEVNIPIDLWDTELEMGFTAGPHSLNGYEALVLVRMRHAYEDVEREQGLPGDVYRAANQRMVITALLKKILSQPTKVPDLMTTMSQYIVIDKNLGLTDIANLALVFKGLNTSTDIWSTRVPNHGGYFMDGDWAAWLTMVKRMDQGLCPVTEDVVDAATGTILQSAGTGTIDDLKDLDSTYKTEPDAADGADAAA